MKKKLGLTVLAAGLIGILFISFETSDVEAIISDGSHGGNPHFYFLSPIVKNVSYSGVADTTLAPVVEICPWTGTSCGPPILIFETTSDLGEETIRLSEAGNYIVNWHTDDTPGDHVDYRIVVKASGRKLGFADIKLVNGGKEAHNPDTGDVVPLQDGRTLPIRFRTEEGALLPY